LGRSHWINKEALVRFILSCQDLSSGGFADRPGDIVDPFHTLFGRGAVFILGYEGDKLLKLKAINPILCMSQEVIDRLAVEVQILKIG